MFEQRRFEFILRAEQPIAHHEETFGNSAVAMRQTVQRSDGSFVRVPIITGDSMRHGLRESAAYATLSAAGLLGEHLSEAVLRLLFAGGVISGSSKAISLRDYATFVDLMPMLSLLGCCAQNRTIPGKMEVDSALLICEETREFWPEWVSEYIEKQSIAVSPHRSYLEEVQRVRMDPALQPGKRALLTAGDRASIEARLIESESASQRNDHDAKAKSKSDMMPRRFERIVQGSLFYWALTAWCHSLLDRDTLMTMLASFIRHAVVGGKRGTGHGLLRPVVAKNVELAPFHDRTEALVLEAPIGALFRSHVAERSEQIKDLLSSVVA